MNERVSIHKHAFLSTRTSKTGVSNFLKHFPKRGKNPNVLAHKKTFEKTWSLQQFDVRVHKIRAILALACLCI